VLGGGDGLAIREVLKYDTVEAITLVDLDEQITQLFSTNPMLTALNQNALRSPKVTIVNDDAFIWLEQNQEMFDFVVVDFPDPSNYSLGKLYTTAFYKLLRKHVSEQGIMAIQSTSSYFAPRSFWCIAATLESVGFQVNAYHTYVPSFGDWGFVIASQRPYQPPESYPDHLKYLTPEIAKGMFHFPEDMQPVDGLEVNRLSNQILTRYFEEEWRQVVR
jgi:spermidine synthase